jgi:hypothetical protein
MRHSAQKTQNNHRTAAKRHAREIKTVANHALALHRAPALFLQIATEFATIGSMSSPSQPIRLNAEDKLAALRRLDKGRAWKSLDDQLYCTPSARK